MSGRGTSGGVVFQAEVGACLAALLLTERPMSRVGNGIPGTPKKLFFEAASAVDDILVETDCGQVYIQAKRTISLSKNADSELASVTQQFVRQFRAGAIDDGIRRNLNISHDRLILAVGDETPNTVAINLQQALERNRTGAATALPGNLKSALSTFSDLIDDAWFGEVGTTISQANKEVILSLCTVIKIGESQRQLGVEILQNIVTNTGDETALYGLLVKWAANSSQSGVGGNTASIRSSLRGIISLKEAPSFREDINKLYAYSNNVTNRLKRFTELSTPEGNITISRPIVNLIAEEARNGSLVITGEPGAGKSAVIYHVAEKLTKEATVVTLTVEAGAISLNDLRKDIQLEHPLIDVLKQMTGHQPAYLLLDALDAVRGGLAEQTYRKLIQEVVALPEWHVIASVRTFDLRLGKEWRTLFRGTAPWSDHSDKNFINVRHVHIGLLDSQEKADLALKSPILSAAIEAVGPRMETLTQNAFNLGLVADLLKGGFAAGTLALVKTRGQLLERYWQERITELGTPAVVALKTIVSLMIASRSIDLPETEIPMDTTITVDNLQKVGVLITESTRRIGFRHHVLFDYAVARLMLLPDRMSAVRLMSKSNSGGLLLSPSLGYWLEEFKGNAIAIDYWAFIISLIGDENTDPIIRIEVARLAVESVSQQETLIPLAKVLKQNNLYQASAFGHLVGSLLTKAAFKQSIEVGPWAELLSELNAPTQEHLGSMRALLGVLLEYKNSQEVMKLLGIASRTLFDAISANEKLIPWLAPHAIKFVAQTYATNQQDSRRKLEKIFLDDRFNQFGHIEIPSLSNEVLILAPHASDIIVELYYRVFLGGNFSRDHLTSMSNSWILSLTSNAAQDFSIARHIVAESFPVLIEQFPKTGIRAFAAMLRALYKNSYYSQSAPEVQTLRYGKTEKAFNEDLCHTWAWDIEDDQFDEDAKIYQCFVNWATAIDDPAILKEIPDILLQETGTALAWRTLFRIGSVKIETIGKLLWHSAADPVALKSLDTRQSAIELISAVYPHILPKEREQAEITWLQEDFSMFQRAEAIRQNILGTLFENIGEAYLATEGAQALLKEAKKDGGQFQNKKPFEVEIITGHDDQHWLEHEGIDLKSKEVAPLITLSNSVKYTIGILEEREAKEHGLTLWETVLALDAGINSFGNTVDSLVDQEISSILAQGLGIALSKSYVPVDFQEQATRRLLELTYHYDPQPSDDTETSFAAFMSWRSPSPRIEAAQAIAKLVANPEIWPIIEDRFKYLLLNDPHPAVRFQLSRALAWTEKFGIDEMWELVETFFAKETNISVIKHALNGLAKFASRDAIRLESIVTAISKRISQQKAGNDIVTQLVMFFAINKNLPASHAVLNTWIINYPNEENRLHSALFDIRSSLVIGFDTTVENQEEIRGRSIRFLNSLIQTIEPAVKSWPLSGREPTIEEKVALKLLDSIATQLYHAVGHDKLVPELKTDSAKRQFLTVYSPIISKLTTLGTPGTVHHILQLLSKFIDVEPQMCFDLISEALLRTTGVAKYQYESMGASLFIQLISLYLADYRFIFSDRATRDKLVECLALFVEAGWPEARQLFQNLQELLQ